MKSIVGTVGLFVLGALVGLMLASPEFANAGWDLVRANTKLLALIAAAAPLVLFLMFGMRLPGWWYKLKWLHQPVFEGLQGRKKTPSVRADSSESKHVD